MRSNTYNLVLSRRKNILNREYLSIFTKYEEFEWVGESWHPGGTGH